VRTKRIKEAGEAYYHVISRVVDRRFVFTDDEKERYCLLLRKVEAFSGVRVLTHSAMDNHTHELLHVPERRPVPEEEVIERMAHLYPPTEVRKTTQLLKALRQSGNTTAAEAILETFRLRMFNLSEFEKTLKQRITQSYNRRHGRKGTLWEERFKSVLVEGSGDALATVAAYIDLNPVRAGIVSDPKDYRFCGYGEGCGGNARAREGLQHIVSSMGECSAWEDVASRYRTLLYVGGEEEGLGEDGRAIRPGFSDEQIQKVLDVRGKLPKAVILRCRVRYFSDGVVLGSRRYVDDIFHRHRHQFGAKRQSGPRSMRGADWGDLYTVRRLQLAPITL
jgi:putative transposase